MDMIKSRIQSLHTYNLETAQAVVRDVVDLYAALFAAFAQRMEVLAHG